MRNTLNPVWREPLTLREFHARARPAHQHGAALLLAGQPAALVFTIFASEVPPSPPLVLSGHAASLTPY